MNNNEFNDYVTKVLNVEENNIFKQYLINSNFNNFTQESLDKLPMLYMPNIKITTYNLTINKKIIYLVADSDEFGDYYLKHKLSLQTLSNEHFSLLNIKIIVPKDIRLISCLSFVDLNTITYDWTNKNQIKCYHVYNVIKQRILDTFMLMHRIFVDDIAKLLFLMYYDVAFG